jgi:hypothetical protein
MREGSPGDPLSRRSWYLILGLRISFVCLFVVQTWLQSPQWS